MLLFDEEFLGASIASNTTQGVDAEKSLSHFVYLASEAHLVAQRLYRRRRAGDVAYGVRWTVD